MTATALLALAIAISSHGSPGAPSFTGVGDLPSGHLGSTVSAVSPDGRIVVGYSNTRAGPVAFRWHGGVLERLVDPAGRRPSAVSDTGVIVGTGVGSDGAYAFRAADDGAGETVHLLPDLTATLGVSGDGRTIVGYRQSREGSRARVVRDGGSLDPGPLPDGTPPGLARAVSHDGSVIVGEATTADGTQAFRWTADDGALPLGDLPGGLERQCTATATSADGSVVVGFSSSSFGTEAFRWQDGRMEGLGGLSDELAILSYAHGVSGDGSIIVGSAVRTHGSSEAFIWDAINGMRALRDLLAHDLELDLFGWKLTAAQAISSDGRTIVGNGVNRAGRLEGWVARLPAGPLPSADRDHEAALVPRVTIGGLSDPAGLAIDDLARIYVANAGAGEVRRFDRDGVALDVWRALRRPVDVGLAADGRCVVLDAGARQVVVLDHGSVVQSWPVEGRPIAMSVVGDLVYLADASRSRVTRHDLLGAVTGSLDLPATDPGGVTLDGRGRMLVADGFGGRIVVRAAGEGTGGREPDAWGSWGTAPGLFRDPAGLAAAGDVLLVADTRNHRIQVLDAAGTSRAAWGRPVVRPREGEGRLHYPSDVAIARDRSFVVVSEPREDRCQVFDRVADGRTAPPPRSDQGALQRRFFGPSIAAAGGLIAVTVPDRDEVELFIAGDTGLRMLAADHLHEKITTTVGGHGRRAGQMRAPGGVALDATGERLYVSDTGNGRVQLFRIERSAGAAGPGTRLATRLVRSAGGIVTRPAAIAVGPAGLVHVADRGPVPRIVVLDADLGDARWMEIPAGVDPVAITVTEDQVLVADASSGEIAVLGRDGSPEEVWAQNARGLAVDDDGIVYVTDDVAHQIVLLDPTGGFIAGVGGPGLGRGQFHKPRGIAVDDVGRLVVCDWGNHRIQVFEPDGRLAALFGASLYTQPARD